MATFEQIRQYLTTNYDTLVMKVGSRDRLEFEETFQRLQADWNQEDDESSLLNETLDEMRKYSPVWKELQSAQLVTDQSHPVSTPAHVTARAKSNSTPRPHHDDADAGHDHPSQRVVNRLALWDKLIVVGKEILTGLIGLAIVVVTLVIAILTINSVSNQNTYNAAKDVLLFMNGLVGVVLGYYFGRVPADVRADRAERDARSANNSRAQVVATVRTVLDEGSRSAERDSTGRGLDLTPSQVERLRSVLRQFDE